MTRFILSAHAAKRLIERKVTRDELMAALYRPTVTRHTGSCEVRVHDDIQVVLADEIVVTVARRSAA